MVTSTKEVDVAMIMRDPLAVATKSSSVIDDPLLNPKPAFEDPLMNPSPSSLTTTTTTPSIMSSSNAGPEVVKAVDKLQTTINDAWILRRERILYEYAVSGTITMNSSAIVAIQGSGLEDGSATRHLDKYNQRLASLEKRQLKEETVSLTHIEYSAHVDKLVAELEQSWVQSKLVDALRIAIQISKLLSDTTAPSFYPYSFIKVTQALDKFGNMVFQRLKMKADEAWKEKDRWNKALAEDFTSNDVPLPAKETCRNWFYKCACIRELLPRVYLELSLFKCYRFLTDDDFSAILSRVGSVIRGSSI